MEEMFSYALMSRRPMPPMTKKYSISNFYSVNTNFCAANQSIKRRLLSTVEAVDGDRGFHGQVSCNGYLDGKAMEAVDGDGGFHLSRETIKDFFDGCLSTLIHDILLLCEDDFLQPFRVVTFHGGGGGVSFRGVVFRFCLSPSFVPHLRWNVVGGYEQRS